MVARLLRCSVSLAQKPKSVILTLPREERRTLSDLMSRWMMFWEWRWMRPLQVCVERVSIVCVVKKSAESSYLIAYR